MVTSEQKERYQELRKICKKIQKKSYKQTKRSFYIFVVIGAIIGISAAVAAIRIDKSGTMKFDAAFLYFYGALLLFILFNILHIIIHEAGHLVFGLMTGYKFLSFRVYSFMFIKKNDHIYRRKYSLKGTAGQCLMYPPKRNEDGSFPFVLYNLGGGLSNLAISLILLIAVLFTHNIIIRVICIDAVLAGLLTAVTNIIPLNYGIQNDGMNLKSMLKDETMQDAFYLQLKMNAELSDGKKITDYTPDTFILPEDSDDTNMLTAFVRFMLYYWQLANHDYDLAEKTLVEIEEKLDQYLPATYNMAEAERLFFMLLRHRPIEEIASVYEHCRLLLLKAKTNIDIQRIRLIYELFLTEEEKRDVMTLINKKSPKKWKVSDKDKLYQEFLKLAENFPVSGEAEFNLEIVQDIKKRYEEGEILSTTEGFNGE